MQPDSCDFRNPSETQFTPNIETHLLNRSSEPLTPLVVNDFNENDYDILNELKLDQETSIDHFSKQQLQNDLLSSGMGIKNVRPYQEQNRADGINCR